MSRKRGTIIINEDDIVGKRFEKLEVIKYDHCWYDFTNGGEKLRHYYKVKCDCGTTKIVRRSQLIGRNVKSCGCLKRKRRS